MKTKYKILSFVILGITFVTAGFGVLYLSPGLTPDERLLNAQDLKPKLYAADIAELVDANNQFALKFYSQVAQDGNENIFFSPTSISTAFAMLYEGADGNTSAQMQDVFGFEQDDSKRREGFAKMQELLNPQDEQYKLRLANALWLAHGFEPLPEYVNTATTYYDSKVETVEFTSSNGIDTINEWVNDKTEGKIEKIFDEPLPPETILAITNAIYFKGTWVDQFDKKNTVERQFHITEEKSVIVPMMNLPRQQTELKYAQNDHLSILELPYEGNDISMLILLPHNIEGLESLEESLSVENLSKWKNDLKKMRVAVFLPKFTMETDYTLNKHLVEMGMPDAFDAISADFSKISGSKDLFVGPAIHKAFVDVNEEGTEAAAATGIATLQSGLAFRADHPFIFIIQDDKTGSILFMGKVVDPSQ